MILYSCLMCQLQRLRTRGDKCLGARESCWEGQARDRCPDNAVNIRCLVRVHARMSSRVSTPTELVAHNSCNIRLSYRAKIFGSLKDDTRSNRRAPGREISPHTRVFRHRRDGSQGSIWHPDSVRPLAVASMPVMCAFRRRRVWGPLAVSLTVLIDALLLGGVVMLVTNSLGSLNDKVLQYAVLAQALGREWLYALEVRGFPASTLMGLDFIESDRIIAFTTGALQTVASLLSLVFMASLVMIFVLAEATIFPSKLQAFWRGDRQGLLNVTRIVKEVQTYLGLKSSVWRRACARPLCAS